MVFWLIVKVTGANKTKTSQESLISFANFCNIFITFTLNLLHLSLSNMNVYGLVAVETEDTRCDILLVKRFQPHDPEQ